MKHLPEHQSVGLSLSWPLSPSDSTRLWELAADCADVPGCSVDLLPQTCKQPFSRGTLAFRLCWKPPRMRLSRAPYLLALPPLLHHHSVPVMLTARQPTRHAPCGGLCTISPLKALSPDVLHSYLPRFLNIFAPTSLSQRCLPGYHSFNCNCLPSPSITHNALFFSHSTYPLSRILYNLFFLFPLYSTH